MYKKCLRTRADCISNDILITVDSNISIQDLTMSLTFFVPDEASVSQAGLCLTLI